MLRRSKKPSEIMRQAQFAIVAQVTQKLLLQLEVAHWKQRLGMLGLALVLPFLGVVTAFGIAPHTVTDDVVRSNVVDTLALPAVVPAHTSEIQTFWREERVQRGDRLAGILARLGVNAPGMIDKLAKVPEAKPLFELTPGRVLRAATSETGELLTLQYLNGEQVLMVQRDGDAYEITDSSAGLETHEIVATGVIHSSFFAAIDAARVPDAITKKMVEIFSTEIDFYRGLRRGDRFTLVYEMHTNRGEFVNAGRLLAAEFVTRGKTHSLLWYEEKPGKGGGAYFTFDGRDTRKSAFLQTPLEVSRVSISSGFTEERFHPLLQTSQAHKGVDFVAPIGTRILAAADGVVDFAGVQQGYGNVVILKHHDKYSTLYAHLQDFEAGIAKGTKVKQGEVIGTVGMTGLTTGPHLHFEFLIDGVHHDPMSVDMPKSLPLAADVKKAIQQAAAPYARMIALKRDTQLAAFE